MHEKRELKAIPLSSMAQVRMRILAHYRAKAQTAEAGRSDERAEDTEALPLAGDPED
jgi:hypothetical protein